MQFLFFRFLTLTTILSQVVAQSLHIGVTRDLKDKDKKLIPPTGRMSYSAAIQLETPVSTDHVTDDHLIWLARKGYEEMESEYKRGLGKPGGYTAKDTRQPIAMAVLAPAKGSEIFLASSVEGFTFNKMPFSDLYRALDLLKALEECGATSHPTAGKCAEINVLDLFFSQQENNRERLKGSKIVVWGKPTPDCTFPRILPPCLRGLGACSKFLGKFSVTSITMEPTGWVFEVSSIRKLPSEGASS